MRVGDEYGDEAFRGLYRLISWGGGGEQGKSRGKARGVSGRAEYENGIG